MYIMYVFFLFSFVNFQNYSVNSKHHYRHDHITRGICMNWCRKKMMHFDHDTRMQYYMATYNEDLDKLDPNIFRNALVRRAHNHKLANMCVNFELKRQYALMGESSIEYCISSRDEMEIGNIFVFFFLFIFYK